MAENAKRSNFISSDNFLSYVMHEWMHSVHLNNLLIKNKCNEDDFLKNVKKIKQIEITDSEKEMIQELLGDYVYNQGRINPLEVSAEGLNKIVCSCLSKDKIAITRSIDEAVEELPMEFLQMLNKILK